MAARSAQTYLTPAEYIGATPMLKHPYVKGEIIAMSGASRAHNLITGNISGELRAQLRGSECETYAAVRSETRCERE